MVHHYIQRTTKWCHRSFGAATGEQAARVDARAGVAGAGGEARRHPHRRGEAALLRARAPGRSRPSRSWTTRASRTRRTNCWRIGIGTTTRSAGCSGSTSSTRSRTTSSLRATGLFSSGAAEQQLLRLHEGDEGARDVHMQLGGMQCESGVLLAVRLAHCRHKLPRLDCRLEQSQLGV